VHGPRHDHAKRVMESYENEWLAERPLLLAVMQIVGLFDRPASGNCLKALRAKPAIEGLTEQIVALDDGEWQSAVERLREAQLLAPADLAAPDALDAHPLVREWFGERLKQTNVSAWKAGHSRLYEHLRDTTKEGATPTLEELAPLYQAISHGCRASRYEETFRDVLVLRIYRQTIFSEFYSTHKLGAVGSDLAAIAWFLDEAPSGVLPPAICAVLVTNKGFCLRAQGRFAEALPAMRSGFRMFEQADDWDNAASSACSLSETELLAGDVAAALLWAERSIVNADRSGNDYYMIRSRTTCAAALHAGGLRDQAELLFAEAEKRQRKMDPGYKVLHSALGYHYCDLLLGRNEWAAARDRAKQTVERAKLQNVLLDIALDTLTLGRAHLGLAQKSEPTRRRTRSIGNDVALARSILNDAIDRLRMAHLDTEIPRGLIARAAFRRSVGDWGGAAQDLDEVEEIAEPSPMRLFLCDAALERARVALAQSEAFAPLIGFIEGGSTTEKRLGETQRKSLRDEAAKQILVAVNHIEKCSYHRRNEELAELEAVLRGNRKFADLPPRV
jgi:tetratricopeptide (TPR) repeat protein